MERQIPFLLFALQKTSFTFSDAKKELTNLVPSNVPFFVDFIIDQEALFSIKPHTKRLYPNSVEERNKSKVPKRELPRRTIIAQFRKLNLKTFYLEDIDLLSKRKSEYVDIDKLKSNITNLPNIASNERSLFTTAIEQEFFNSFANKNEFQYRKTFHDNKKRFNILYDLLHIEPNKEKIVSYLSAVIQINQNKVEVLQTKYAKKQTKINKYVAFSSIVMTIFTAVTALFAYLSWDFTKKQAAYTRAQAIISYEQFEKKKCNSLVASLLEMECPMNTSNIKSK